MLVPGDGTQIGLRFVEARMPRSERNRLHLHLASETEDDQRHAVAAVVLLGGRRRGSKPLPIGRDIYASDPGGNDFCIIEPGNGYLAGCGLLAEVTCDGPREAGLFWRDALDWPLVWDHGQETAIQSPSGGTKLAWDSWSASPQSGRQRQRFDLLADDPVVEIDRLTALGASVLRAEVGGRNGGASVLADPAGDEFSLRHP